ncbi:S8 family serine peptidase [Thermaerobacillus caldiproteolyticus]|uniref:Subtilisin family serine protease n=1 Tax=Thermaerobacillus caldiproteolyticus TaxID=247480 RepID=A0A7V9Z5Q9_9BACL|nr:S8 family serine peptidase [Anoxybacillus caldiproteolyticus]MBA2874563.1 subtilisin family serine protease [Anoxybacillus caldiproteolyticus]
MKKWQKAALSFGLASTLVLPSFAQATTLPPLEQLKKQPYNVVKAPLAYKQLEEAQNQISEDTLIVKYKDKIPASVHRSLGANVKKSFPQLGYDVVTLQKGKTLQEVARNYAKLKTVTSVTPSFTYKKLGTNDPKNEKMYPLSLLQIDKALQLAGKHSVTVAVIDTGLDMKHPDLKAQLLPSYNAANPANPGVKDLHGTHVAGIIGATANNGVGAHGINPNVKILPIDVFNGGAGASDYVIAQGILYAIEKGAKVINMSLGGYFNSPILEDAVKKAIDAGVTVVAAAGNDATDMYSIPASYEGVISVGATDSKNHLANFSNYGPSVDIVAPGVDVYSTVYDPTKGASFAELSGTSMASPVVAGVASLILSKYPNLKPYEVEAILERTATDLGEKGYDLKYANGLVNPVAALQFNLKNLPKKETWNDETILAKALPVQLTEKTYTKTGSFKTPEEVHWMKVDLQGGESVQAVLDGAKDYDYKLIFRFYPEGKKQSDKPINVNDTHAGEVEGKLYTAKENGTLVIGVTDANGNYSLQGKSTYTLTLQKFAELTADPSTKDNPVAIEQLPFDSEKTEFAPFTFVPENEKEADKDYFKLTVKEPTTIKLNLSAIPGIDSSLSVYFAEDFYRQADPNAKEQESPSPIAIANNNGSGKGETLTFEAQPDTEYIIEASSEPVSDFVYYGSYPTSSDEGSGLPASAIPYRLTAEQVTSPPDEDGYPSFENPEENGSTEETSPAAEQQLNQNTKKRNAIIVEDDGTWRNFEKEDVQQIREQALPYNIGGKQSGYIQFGEDLDFYKLSVNETAIYQFTFDTPDDMIPWATIYEYDAKQDDLSPVADYYGYDYFTGKKTSSLTLVLEKGKEYYLSVANDRYQPVADPYTFVSKKLMDAPKDANEDNNEPIRATVVQPNKVTTGNLVLPNDVDIYYYKHRKADEIFTFFARPNKLENEANLPEDLRGTLIPIITVVEDTNGNMNIDQDEASKAIDFWPNELNPMYDVNGSFKAKKDTGYFFINNGFSWGGLSLQSYRFGIETLNKKDEDAASVVKNNVPSKPLGFKKEGSTYKATGYLNTSVDYGDKDYYTLTVTKDGKFTVKLDGSSTMDGVISIYNEKGGLVQTFDYYGEGDSEVATISLKKGKYYFVVEDSFARPNAQPYTLSISPVK